MGELKDGGVGQGTAILGFDSWAKGSYHFERLLPALSKRGLTLTLVHLGSWGNDPGRPGRERLGNLDVRDISSYGSNSLETVLDVERPAVVVLLSTDTFAHRAMVRYCRARSIKTLLLYHGLVNVQDMSEAGAGYTVNRLAHLRFVVSKLAKVIRHTLPCYVWSLIQTRGRSRDWIRFGADVVSLATGKFPATAAADARTTKCAVYTQADVSHATGRFDFAPADVRVVGNPDLIRFGLTDGMLGSRVAPSPADRSRRIVYVETGLVAAGYVFPSIEAYRDHILETAKVLASQGLTLIFKPKPYPAMLFQALVGGLEGSSVEILGNDEFLPALQTCAACIVEATTLALVPALMGVPLLYANYGRMSELRFGPVLTSYPRGYALRDLADVSTLLSAAHQTFEREEVERWIALNAGPLPIDKMPSRVADLIADLKSVSMMPCLHQADVIG